MVYFHDLKEEKGEKNPLFPSFQPLSRAFLVFFGTKVHIFYSFVFRQQMFFSIADPSFSDGSVFPCRLCRRHHIQTHVRPFIVIELYCSFHDPPDLPDIVESHSSQQLTLDDPPHYPSDSPSLSCSPVSASASGMRCIGGLHIVLHGRNGVSVLSRDCPSGVPLPFPKL